MISAIPDPRSKFLDANGDGIFDLRYFPFAASPQYQLPEPWQIHVGTTSSLGDFDNSSIVISNRGKGSLIATWAGRQALRINPEDADAWNNLGVAYAQSGQRGKVLEVYKRLKTLDPVLAERFFKIFVMP